MHACLLCPRHACLLCPRHACLLSPRHACLLSPRHACLLSTSYAKEQSGSVSQTSNSTETFILTEDYCTFIIIETVIINEFTLCKGTSL